MSTLDRDDWRGAGARRSSALHSHHADEFRTPEAINPDRALLEIKNRPPGAQYVFPAKDVVDAGFLELVRYGVRKANGTLIEDSVHVVDQVLRVETPFGPCWRRYNHDGYGHATMADHFWVGGAVVPGRC